MSSSISSTWSADAKRGLPSRWVETRSPLKMSPSPTSSTLPTCSPSEPTTSQPSSIRSQETGCSFTPNAPRRTRPAPAWRRAPCRRARAGSRALRESCLRRGARSSAASSPANAVAERARDAEAQDRLAARPRPGWRVPRAGAALQPVAGDELDLAVDVAPVVREARRRPRPRLGEGVPGSRDLGLGVGLVRPTSSSPSDAIRSSSSRGSRRSTSARSRRPRRRVASAPRCRAVGLMGASSAAARASARPRGSQAQRASPVLGQAPLDLAAIV